MKSTSVICGVDLGSWTVKICVNRGDTFQILTNQANFRETPSLVGYTPTERLVGEPALIKLKTNHANTIRAPHRLLNLELHPHLLELELSHCQVKYCQKDDILFTVQHQEGPIQVSSEEVLVSLLNKVNNIMDIHNLHLSLAYISVPTYLSQAARHSLKQAAEISLGKAVRLVDEWVSLASHYSFTRLKQLKMLHQMRHVLFLNLGYSSFSLSLVQFTQFEARLIDSQHLPYTGCKNMDQHLTNFYVQLFQKQTGKDIYKNPKAFVKLTDAVQKLRTVLSANSEHHINLEYLLGEEDLTSDMTRQQFEDAIVPVLSDLAAGMASLQARNSSVPIHALELMGGGSRIPCLQAMASQIFGMELSRTLNQSQSVAIGTTIFGALQLKLLNFPYSFDTVAGRQIAAKWGANKKALFFKNTRLPYQQTLNFAYEGPADLTLFFQQGPLETQMARFKFNTPNRVTFTLDSNKILSAQASVTPFQLCNIQHQPLSKWDKIKQNEHFMRKMDIRINMLYQLRNSYQTHFYWCKNNLPSLANKISQEKMGALQEQLGLAQKWVEDDHHRHIKGSEQDLSIFQSKVKEIKSLRENMEAMLDKNTYLTKVKQKYDKLMHLIAQTLEKPLDEQGQKKLEEVMTWGQDAYQKMQSSGWSSQDLSLDKIEEATSTLAKIGKNK